MDSVTPLPKGSYQKVASIPLLNDDTNTRVVALGPDRSMLIAEHAFSGGDRIAQDRLALLPGGTDPPIHLPDPKRSKPQQVTGAALSERWVVWMETTSNGVDVQPWVIYAFDRIDRRTTELARSSNIDGNPPPPPPGFTGPVLSGERVFWAQVGGSFGAETVDVYGCRISECRPVRYARGAAFPAATSDALYVIATGRYTGDTESRPTSISIRKIDPTTKRGETIWSADLQPGQQPGGLAASEDGLVWILAGSASVAIVRDLNSGATTQIEAESDGLFGFPVALDGFVAWAESSGTSQADVGGYVFDLTSGVLNSIGNTAGLYSIHGSGEFLSWQDARTASARPEDIRTTVVRLR